MYKTDYLQNGAKRRDVYVDVVYHISPRAALALLLGALLLVLGLVAAASNPWNPPPMATTSAPAATSSSTTAPAASSIPPASSPAARILDINTDIPSPGFLQISIKVVLYTHIYIFMSQFVNLGRKIAHFANF
jgi:hypothetical protein